MCLGIEQIIQTLIIINSNFLAAKKNHTRTQHVCYGQTLAERHSLLFSFLHTVYDKCRCIKMLKYAWLIYLAIWCVFMCNKFLERTTQTYTHKIKWWIKWRMMWSYYLECDLRWRLRLSMRHWVYVCVCQSWHKLL